MMPAFGTVLTPTQFIQGFPYSYADNEVSSYVLYEEKAYIAIARPNKFLNPDEDPAWLMVGTLTGDGAKYTAVKPLYINDKNEISINLSEFFAVDSDTGDLVLSQEFIDILNDAFDEVYTEIAVVDKKAEVAKKTADDALAQAKKSIQTIRIKDTETVTGKATPDGKGGVDLEFTASGGGGSSDRLITKIGTTSSANALYGLVDGGLARVQGLDYSGNQTYVVDVKDMTKIVGFGTQQGSDLVGNYFALRAGGKLVCWQTINAKYSNKLLSAEDTIATNVKSFDVATTQSVDGKSTIIIVAYVNENNNIDLLIKTIDSATGKVSTGRGTSSAKPTDHNLKIFINDDGVAGSTLKNFFHIIHWNVNNGGAFSVAYDYKNMKFLDDKITKIISTGNQGPFVLGNTPKYGVLTAPAINKRVVLLYTSTIGVIASVDKSTNVVQNEVANINYDLINNCMLFTYLNGVDGLESTLSTQAEADMWTTDRQSNLIRLSNSVILNFWALNDTTDKKYNGNIVNGVAGQYLWTIRNPNGQISVITFSTASDYRIYPRCEEVLDYFVPSNAPPCMIKQSDILVTILAINSSRATQAYWGCDMPMVGPINFLGQAVDNAGNIAFKGRFVFSGSNLEVGKRYYVDFVGNGKYNISTNPKSGICVGLATSATTTIY